MSYLWCIFRSFWSSSGKHFKTNSPSKWDSSSSLTRWFTEHLPPAASRKGILAIKHWQSDSGAGIPDNLIKIFSLCIVATFVTLLQGLQKEWVTPIKETYQITVLLSSSFRKHWLICNMFKQTGFLALKLPFLMTERVFDIGVCHLTWYRKTEKIRKTKTRIMVHCCRLNIWLTYAYPHTFQNWDNYISNALKYLLLMKSYLWKMRGETAYKSLTSNIITSLCKSLHPFHTCKVDHRLYLWDSTYTYFMCAKRNIFTYLGICLEIEKF